MISALAASVESPADGIRIVEVPGDCLATARAPDSPAVFLPANLFPQALTAQRN